MTGPTLCVLSTLSPWECWLLVDCKHPQCPSLGLRSGFAFDGPALYRHDKASIVAISKCITAIARGLLNAPTSNPKRKQLTRSCEVWNFKTFGKHQPGAPPAALDLQVQRRAAVVDVSQGPCSRVLTQVRDMLSCPLGTPCSGHVPVTRRRVTTSCNGTATCPCGCTGRGRLGVLPRERWSSSR